MKNTTTFADWYGRNFGERPPVYMERDRKRYLKQYFELFQAFERLDVAKVINSGGMINDLISLMIQYRNEASKNEQAVRDKLGREYDAIVGNSLLPATSWIKKAEK